MNSFLCDGPLDAPVHMLLAHGAGAPMTSPFMETIVSRLAASGLRVHRFEFDYMAQRRAGGSRRPPPKAEHLVSSYQDAVAHWAATHVGSQRLYIGGKSLGGRVASLAADDLYRSRSIAGLICLGYPFHPPKQPAKTRTAHLEGLCCPALIVQGSRDPFGTREDVAQYTLSKSIQIDWIEDANHDFERRAARRNSIDPFDEAATAVTRFVALV